MLKKLFKSGFFKSLMVLAGGSLIGTVIIAVCEIARTWIFPESEVGVFTFLLAVPLTFISITALRYDISVVIEEDDRKALALVKLSGLLTLLISLLVMIGFMVYILGFKRDYIKYLYVTPLIPLITMGYGVNNLLNAYNNRYKEYGTISKKYVIRTAVQYITTIVFGFIFVYLLKLPALSVLIMMVPYALGLYAGVRNQAKGIIARKEELKSITGAEMWEVAKKHRRQVFFSSPGLFVNSYSFSVITFLIEDIFGTATVAFYSISNRVLGIPISLVSGNVAKVYIEEASREYEKTGRFFNAFKRTLLFLAAMAVPMLLLMYFVAPPVCRIILGEGWEVAGEYIKILSVMFAFRLIGTALSQSLAVCNRQGIELIVNIGLVLASVLSGILTRAAGGDIYYFLKSICISRSICYIGLIATVFICSLGKKNALNDNADPKEQSIAQ